MSAALTPTACLDSLLIPCELRGVVHGFNTYPSGLRFTIIDPTSGIEVWSPVENFNYLVQEGDSVRIRGHPAVPGPRRRSWSTRSSSPRRTSRSGTGIGQRAGRKHRERPDPVEVELVNPAEWTNALPQFEVYVSTGADLYKMVVDADTDLFGTEAPEGIFGVTGIGGQRDDDAPFLDGYTILPRGVLTCPSRCRPTSRPHTVGGRRWPAALREPVRGRRQLLLELRRRFAHRHGDLAVARVPDRQHLHRDPDGHQRRRGLHGPGDPGGSSCFRTRVPSAWVNGMPVGPLSGGPVPFGQAGPLRLQSAWDIAEWTVRDAAGRTVKSGGHVAARSPWLLEADGMKSGWHACCPVSESTAALEPAVDGGLIPCGSPGPILLLHATVVVFGFTGVLGKLITLPAVPLVFWRTLIGALGLHAWMTWRNRGPGIPAALRWPVAGTGVLVAIHWVTFFAAIKASTVSFALAVMATVPFFVSLIEPVVRRRKPDLRVAARPGGDHGFVVDVPGGRDLWQRHGARAHQCVLCGVVRHIEQCVEPTRWRRCRCPGWSWLWPVCWAVSLCVRRRGRLLAELLRGLGVASVARFNRHVHCIRPSPWR